MFIAVKELEYYKVLTRHTDGVLNITDIEYTTIIPISKIDRISGPVLGKNISVFKDSKYMNSEIIMIFCTGQTVIYTLDSYLSIHKSLYEASQRIKEHHA